MTLLEALAVRAHYGETGVGWDAYHLVRQAQDVIAEAARKPEADVRQRLSEAYAKAAKEIPTTDKQPDWHRAMWEIAALVGSQGLAQDVVDHLKDLGYEIRRKGG